MNIPKVELFSLILDRDDLKTDKPVKNTAIFNIDNLDYQLEVFKDYLKNKTIEFDDIKKYDNISDKFNVIWKKYKIFDEET